MGWLTGGESGCVQRLEQSSTVTFKAHAQQSVRLQNCPRTHLPASHLPIYLLQAGEGGVGEGEGLGVAGPKLHQDLRGNSAPAVHGAVHLHSVFGILG